MISRSIQITKKSINTTSIKQFSKISNLKNTIQSQSDASSTIQNQQSSSEIQEQPQLQQQQENLGSFKSFAEYRLKVQNQSPLAVRSKDFNANLRQAQH
ncbi:uncharacterized protein KGF55_003189 [Candida pseudojiufengensis]|uniref:uncharacterized protein n=1 Tax=Candida pseudojiufengensis TaxID=497109 RepID=UPI002224C860|nr:uncharacterized protein KGF55_003189 [Candida pseudojiufengensis]KAI5962113.1 hypothetical protein KGF55_003189 [Candida pseudojiufengensis]